MVRLSDASLETMRRHACEGYPLEICGLLIGAVDGDARVVHHAWPLRNAWEDDPDARRQLEEALQESGASASVDEWESANTERRYLVAPSDVLASMKRARSLGLDLVGVYHTHPEHPAVPSKFDRDVAGPEWSYVILSVRSGEVAEVRSWVALDWELPFEEERIETH